MAGFAGFVQSPTIAAGAVLGGAVSTFSPAAWTNNVVAGNRIVVVTSVWKTGGQQTCTGVIDSAGNTYTKDAQVNHATSQQSLAVFSAPILAGGGTKPTITATASANGCSVGIGAFEYSGLNASIGAGAVDSFGTTTSSVGATPTATTTGNCTVLNELAFAAGGGNGDSKTWSAGTLAGSTGLARGNNTPDANADLFIEDNPSGATGATKAGTFTIGGGGVNSTAIIVLYKLGVTGSRVTGRPLNWRQLEPQQLLRGQVAMRQQIYRFESKPYWIPYGGVASVDTTITPAQCDLLLATFAPTLIAGTVLAPAAATLTLAGFAPTVSTPQTITPGVVALTLTGFAPTLTIGVNIQPASAALVLTGFAPTVLTPSTVTPGVRALVLATFAPTLSIGVYITPGVKALTLATFAPTIITPQIFTPASLALVLATYAPTATVSGGAPISVTPATLALILLGYAPLVGSLSLRVVSSEAAVTNAAGSEAVLASVLGSELVAPVTAGGVLSGSVTATDRKVTVVVADDGLV